MRRFEALLSKAKLTRAEAPNRAFDSPFFRPPSGRLRQRWDQLQAERRQTAGAAKPSAQALLLSYRADSGGSLWLLEARCGKRGDAELSLQARRILERARLLVSRELPALVDHPHGSDAWSVARISTGGEIVLDGDSFGLSMCLIAAAHCLGLASPTNIAATAGVDGDGSLFEVGGLRQKLSILHEWALGVDKLLVSASQLDTAQAVARELGASWRVIGVRSVAEAMTHAFPNLWSDLESRWTDDATLGNFASDLLRLARDGSNHVLSWNGIAEVSERVAAKLPQSSVAFKNARFAALVARRHDGHHALLELDAEHLAHMRRPLRLRCIAHILQSHADCADVLDPTFARAVASTIPSDARDDSPDDLWLLGALGRLLAAFFRYNEAEAALLRSVQGWFELDCVPEASHALCELLRVLAVKRDLEGFTRTEHAYAERFLEDPRAETVSRGFVLYSLGRAHALLENLSEARRRLSDADCDWSLLPDHLRALRLRWLIRVARTERDTATVDHCTRQLALVLERTRTLEIAQALAQLDSALLEQRDPEPALRAFEARRPLEYQRFARAYPEDVGARIVREFRY